MTTRPGAATTAELVLVLWLFGFVLAAMAVFASAHAGLAAAQLDRERASELARTAGSILAGELRHSLPSQVTAVGGDSIRVRAARGAGAICGVAGRELDVRYRGVRDPDPAKDSVLLVSTNGAEHVGLAAAPGGSACGLRLVLDRAPAATGGLALVYETGTYLVAQGALRYRRGQAGRQPLTEAVLSGAASLRATGRGVALDLLVHPDSLPRLRSGAAHRELSILNGWPAP